MAKKSSKKKVRRVRSLPEGGSETLDVYSFSGSPSALLPAKVLQYLKVKSGDKLQVFARNGTIEIAPVLPIEEEIAKYLDI